MQSDNPRLLIVEDDVSSQEYYATILDEDYELELLSEAQEAHEMLGKKEFDIVIIDISLPGEEDGIGLIHYIRKTLRSSIPILVVTANAFPQNRVDSLAAGANEFLTKPILAGTLIEALNKLKGSNHG